MRHLGSRYLDVVADLVLEWASEGADETIGKASNSSSGATYPTQSADFTTNHELVELVGVLADVVTTDTYALLVNNIEVASESLTGGTVDNPMTPTRRIVIGSHSTMRIAIAGTANRSYRFNSGGGPTAGGLGTLGQWIEPGTGNHSPGFRVVVKPLLTTDLMVL